MKYSRWRHVLCSLTWHSWVPVLADSQILCECTACGHRRWFQR